MSDIVPERDSIEARLRASEERLALAQSVGGVATFTSRLGANEWVWTPELGRLIYADPNAPPPTLEEVEGRIFLDDLLKLRSAAQLATQTGRYYVEFRVRIPGGVRWIAGKGETTDGDRIVGVYYDIDERKQLEARLLALNETLEARVIELREEANRLEVLNRTGTALAAELDLERLVQLITDAGVELTHAKFGAFFYNVLNEKGESYLLYTLSGVPREAFAGFPMPRNTAVFDPTFRGAGVVRSDNIQADPRYGKNPPYYGQPKGHLPVRSYLAAPVVARSGEVLGGLFFGHPEPGKFTARDELIVTGIAAQAAIAMDNARLYTARRRAEEELQRANATLEQRVADEVRHRLQVEETLRQSQKMEALGQLTGGIAHDFNNMLAVIRGNLELLQERAKEIAEVARTPDVPHLVSGALRGAARAALLTHRLLAFARRQPLAPDAVQLNKLVAGMSELLQRTLGEAVAVETVLAAGLWETFVDASQFENALVNLAVNARDAMPDGGKLMIETANCYLDEPYAAAEVDLEAGQYVGLFVTDTGVGMAEEVRSKAFEPFFTTKETGQGTGLGLSQVYGFIKQSGGHVKIYSEVGQGTTVKLYLPRYHTTDAFVGKEIGREGEIARARRGETVLVVEDDPDVRSTTTALVGGLGYRVLSAADGLEALRLLDAHPEIALLFTDVVLPRGMNGRQLADEALRRRPVLKVLFTTGYARNAIVHHGRLDVGVDVIFKPFSRSEMAARLRRALDT